MECQDLHVTYQNFLLLVLIQESAEQAERHVFMPFIKS